MNKTQQVIFLQSIRVGCAVAIGFFGLIGFLMFTGNETFHSIWSAFSEGIVTTWRAMFSFDVETLLHQWISGALSLVVFAALGFSVIHLLSQERRN